MKHVELKPYETLAPADLMTHPVWEFVADDIPSEEYVHPVEESLPLSHLDGRLVGTEVKLANGAAKWALIKNVDTNDPRINAQFLSITLFDGDRQFMLARYHDLDFELERYGPEKLAEFLGLKMDEVFPISYDLRRFVKGNPSALVGKVLKEPDEKFSGRELTKIAVRGSMPQ